MTAPDAAASSGGSSPDEPEDADTVAEDSGSAGDDAQAVAMVLPDNDPDVVKHSRDSDGAVTFADDSGS